MNEGTVRPTRSSMATCKLCPPDLEGCYLCCETGPHPFVPRRPYVPRQGAWEGAFEPMKITFRKAGQCGILVRDGISKNFRDLVGRDSRPFQDVEIVDQVTLRIEVSTCQCLPFPPQSLRVSNDSGQVTLLGVQR